MGRSPPASPPCEPVSREAREASLPRLPSLTSGTALGDGILFAGNPHESVPRRLFLDTRLTPLERNAWQVIRLMLNADGVTAFPSYAQLAPFLSSLPASVQASDETIARALMALRLTCWLSLARSRRDPATGRIEGNLYVLHDEPLTPYEALALDPNYLKLVSASLTHASKTLRFLAYRVLNDLTDDPLMTGRVLPSRLDGLLRRLASLNWTESPETIEPRADGPAGEDDPAAQAHLNTGRRQESGEPDHPIVPPPSESADGAPASDSEEGGKSLKAGSLRNPKTVRTVQYKSLNNKIRTVPRAGARASLPERLARLPAEQQAGVLAALQPLELALQQAVLDEWDARCRSSAVRNPAGYLFGLIQRALRGEFHPWAGRERERTASRITDDAPTATAAEIDARRAQAREHIAELKRLLAIRR
jgi:hypothetical protein